jgi:hypothetical protein
VCVCITMCVCARACVCVCAWGGGGGHRDSFSFATSSLSSSAVQCSASSECASASIAHRRTQRTRPPCSVPYSECGTGPRGRSPPVVPRTRRCEQPSARVAQRSDAVGSLRPCGRCTGATRYGTLYGALSGWRSVSAMHGAEWDALRPCAMFVRRRLTREVEELLRVHQRFHVMLARLVVPLAPNTSSCTD